MNMLAYIAQQMVNGLVLGSIYALLALGLTVVYGILRLVNFAHGGLITIGAFIFFYALSVLKINFALTLLLAVLSGACLGFLLDFVAYRKLRGGPEVSLLITSLGVYIFIENITKLLASPQPYAFRPPPLFLRRFTFKGIIFSSTDIFIVIAAVVIMVTFAVFVKRTKLGIAMRATAERIETARLMGINTNKVIVTAFVLGSAIATITGFMWGAKYGQISYDMGFMAGVKAFVATVIGGVGSIPGAMVGGFLLGFAEILLVGALPAGFAEYRDAFVFTILLIVLLLRPTGLMGRKEAL
jgi:branched-chain amino acid transport system permease protein